MGNILSSLVELGMRSHPDRQPVPPKETQEAFKNVMTAQYGGRLIGTVPELQMAVVASERHPEDTHRIYFAQHPRQKNLFIASARADFFHDGKGPVLRFTELNQAGKTGDSMNLTLAENGQVAFNATESGAHMGAIWNAGLMTGLHFEGPERLPAPGNSGELPSLSAHAIEYYTRIDPPQDGLHPVIKTPTQEGREAVVMTRFDPVSGKIVLEEKDVLGIIDHREAPYHLSVDALQGALFAPQTRSNPRSAPPSLDTSWADPGAVRKAVGYHGRRSTPS